MKLCLVQKIFWNIEREMERLGTWSRGSPILKISQRGNRNTIFWIDDPLVIIFNHKNNSSFCALTSCLAYISLIFSYPWVEFGNTQRQNIFVHEFMNAFSSFLKSLYNLCVSSCLHYVMNLISFCLQKFKLSCLQYQVMRTWNYCIRLFKIFWSVSFLYLCFVSEAILFKSFL